jgi:hypothetical protein
VTTNETNLEPVVQPPLTRRRTVLGCRPVGGFHLQKEVFSGEESDVHRVPPGFAPDVATPNTSSRRRPRGLSVSKRPGSLHQRGTFEEFEDQFDLSAIDPVTQEVIKQKSHLVWELAEANDQLSNELRAKETLLAGIGQAGLDQPIFVKIVEGERAIGKVIRAIPRNVQNLQNIVRKIVGQEKGANIRLRRKDGEIRDLDLPNLLMALAENVGEIRQSLVLVLGDE